MSFVAIGCPQHGDAMTLRHANQLERAISRPRIVVVGVTGLGKTTIARQLASLFYLPHIELDALYWEPNWTPAPVEEFLKTDFLDVGL